MVVKVAEWELTNLMNTVSGWNIYFKECNERLIKVITECVRKRKDCDGKVHIRNGAEAKAEDEQGLLGVHKDCRYPY